MADPPKPASPFTFNQASRPDAGTGLFGQPNTSAAASDNSPFGSAVAAPSTTGGSLFGSTPASSAPSGSLFGASTSGPAASSPFGGASKGGPMFGAASNTTGGPSFSFGPPTTTNATTGGIFGSSQPVSQAAPPASGAPPTSLFSTPNKPAGTPATPQPVTNTFGGNPAPGVGGLFGSKPDSKDINTTPTSKQTTSLFGNSTTPAGPPPGASTGAGSGSLFSFKKPESSSNATSNNLFGGGINSAGDSTSSKPTTSSLFAPPSSSNVSESKVQAPQASAQSTNIFGAPPKPSSGGTGLFGSAPSISQPASQGNLFDKTGQPPDAAAGKPVENKSTSGFFSNVGEAPGSTGQPTSSASASSLFANTSKQPSTPSFSFAGPSGSAAASSGTIKPPAVAQSSGLFGKPDAANAAANGDASAPSAAAPKTNFFPSLGQPQNKPADTTTTSTPSFPTATSSAPDAFSNIGKVSSPFTTEEPDGSSTAAPGGTTSTNGANLGASTTGPAPPARSRLKDKTMDDIITRWASDLSKYQKEFQTQAEKVASWDRMLVENSEKIQRLYGSTLEAERATSEVERQLTSVESDQAELESWLSHYETELDNMIHNQVGQGEGLSGPDQERERTYQLATRLSDRLDEMGKDLGSMIEEINKASSGLSKHTKSDDPLTQVVRVLNSHLTQLQQIDVGAANLQMKVKEAQRLGQNMGPPNGLNGPSSEAAEGFYRSYMGRG